MTTTTTLLDAGLTAPLVAIECHQATTLHAATLDEICRAWPHGSVTAPCGAGSLRLLTCNGAVVPWPPAVRDLAPRKRCRACWVATGSRRPRSRRLVEVAP